MQDLLCHFSSGCWRVPLKCSFLSAGSKVLVVVGTVCCNCFAALPSVRIV